MPKHVSTGSVRASRRKKAKILGGSAKERYKRYLKNMLKDQNEISKQEIHQSED